MWYPGDEIADLEGHANVLDQLAKRRVPWDGNPVPFSDNNVIHAPVGSFEFNPFGLHDMHGNLSEWCSNLYWDPSRLRVCRGGSFRRSARLARSALRINCAPSIQSNFQGCRTARALHR